MKKHVLLTLSMLIATCTARADTLFLADNSSVNGEVRYNGDRFSISKCIMNVDGDEAVETFYEWEQVQRIEFNESCKNRRPPKPGNGRPIITATKEGLPPATVKVQSPLDGAEKLPLKGTKQYMTDMEGPEVNAHFGGPGDLKDGVQVRTGISIVTTPPQDIPIQLQLREGSMKKGLLDSISEADVVLKVKSKRKAYPRSEIRWVAIIRK